MHLLNALPQRLDPGATPTFAGLISATLTAPASTNLTLGLGTGGTALTLASSTLAATFAGVVVVPDGSAAAPSLVVSSSPTTGFYRHGSGAIGFSSAGLACAAFSSNTGGGGLYLEALGTNQNIRLVPSGTGILTTAAPVTFTNTTAGSSGAGALVVQGGISAGQSAQASYFGGAVTFGGNLIVAQDKFSNFDGSGAARMGMQAVSVAPYSVRMLGSADAVNTRDFSFGYYTGDNAANAWNQKASINSYTGAATFAGAVAIGNTTAASVAAPSTHKVSILIGGVQYYLLASNV